ncbi:hypothetical protein PEQA60_50400 [Pseudomonas sp. Eqa60]|uniref:DUF4334 domain-containing protein n=1 Tax=Pseudomonas protegens (strain DSM 19095 / LMG 27888 / CFBP 6595 / CHA0) TaxID=1124983 RepID=A0A2C9ESM6_PSEPH|nr:MULTISPECIES: DUF4334 domain-containing protein [Pseudomonas]AGL86672.1 hypothetical protein PFLCHA0_c49220 [Pseudomonas protegens CHA0]MBP5113770.1 DUF4334 domain-containing protein [Pseudomonas protegens]QTU27882.1 DUF4334 domain-containing protein [Pseudomonas protegens]QTU31516.1 DUF4334 domain-containing protein [Pseudomonas protegens]RLO24763.1 DUF4334 domain-containing protein [Pseudomonas protegens]
MNTKEKFEQLKSTQGLNDEVLLDFFDSLSPVTIDGALGRWQGGDFKTGHWGNDALTGMKWYGKWYRSKLDAVPLVCYDEQGRLFSNKIMKGEASLWEVAFRGKVSTTMIYDGVPIYDHLRKVDDNTLFGIMDGKSFEGQLPDIIDNGKYYFFYLERVDGFPVEFV